MGETPTIFLKGARNALVIAAWHAHSLDYSITFLQRPAAYIYFDDACLVCAQACGEHRNVASYFSEAHLASLSRCCRMQRIMHYSRRGQILYANYRPANSCGDFFNYVIIVHVNK